MAKDIKEFETFQEEFKKYQQLFGLTGYKIYFKHQHLDECFAQIDVNLVGMVATASLNSDSPAKDKPHRDAKRSAKHEACHLLLHKLESLARQRYIRSDEIYEACEEIVFKLEGLIQ